MLDQAERSRTDYMLYVKYALMMENPERPSPLAIDRLHELSSLANVAASGMRPIEYLTRGLAGALLATKASAEPVSYPGVGKSINRAILDINPAVLGIVEHVAFSTMAGWTSELTPVQNESIWSMYEDFFPGIGLSA